MVMDGITEKNTLQPNLKAYAEALKISGLCSPPLTPDGVWAEQ